MKAAKVMNLTDFNRLNAAEAADLLQTCCAAENWISAMQKARPYRDLEQLSQLHDEIWASMQERDLLQAFAAHPRIGDVNSLQKKYANTLATASSEQAGVSSATAKVLEELAEKNQLYFERFGFIFIVFASGKDAQTMLTLLNARIHNTRNQELQLASREQQQITALRLTKLFDTSSIAGE